MPLTYNAIYLGQAVASDPTEGNITAENASALVGMTFGSPTHALANNIVMVTAQNVGGEPTMLEANNSIANDHFLVHGLGTTTTYIMDAAVLYRATLTYLDGSTVSNVPIATAQMTNGDLYLVPSEPWGPTDDLLEAAPLRSVTITGVQQATYDGLKVDRPIVNFPTCFLTGTRIATAKGSRAVEEIRVGDLVLTEDHGPQPVRWISRQRFGIADMLVSPGTRPVRLAAGCLGAAGPLRDLCVSQQHRLLVEGEAAVTLFGVLDVLVAARHLIGLPGIALLPVTGAVAYCHLLLDRHEIVRAEGMATETMLCAPGAMLSLGPASRTEIRLLLPHLLTSPPEPARRILTGREARALAARLRRGQAATVR